MIMNKNRRGAEMKTVLKPFTVIVGLLTVVVYIHGAENIEFNTDLIRLSPSDAYTTVEYSDGFYPCRPGYPELPAVNELVEVPDNVVISGLIIDMEHWVDLPGTVIPRPQPRPCILGSTTIKPVSPCSEIYSDNRLYPYCPVELKGISRRNGRNIAMIQVTPFRFDPVANRVQFLTHLEYHLDVVGTEGLAECLRKADNRVTPAAAPGAYLIITSETLEPVFAPLAEWKTQKGLNCATATVEMIDIMYPGEDLSARIRAFIRDEVQNSGVQYVLLGGNRNHIPIRYAWAMDSESGNNDLGADLYYADLDGTWDEDQDGTYGEVADAVDLYPDVCVGRAPVDSAAEAAAFVDKVLTYEKNPPDDYCNRMLFMAAILWYNPFTDASLNKEKIDLDSVPSRFNPIRKLYEIDANLTTETVFNWLNAGGHIANYNGHSGQTAWGVIPSGFTSTMAYNLLNGDKQWIIYSTGCLSNRFSQRCVGSQFVVNGNGGAVAYIGNYSYGWGMPGNPLFGYSDIMDRKFFELLFGAEWPRLGEIFTESKAYYTPQSQQENVYRWLQYNLNLNGDPEMPVWTDQPAVMAVDAPDSMASSATAVPVWVYDDAGGIPGALVCLYRNGECHETGMTDTKGNTVLNVPSGLSGPPLLTVTAWNHLPVQKQISIGDLPDLRVNTLNPDDSTGPSTSGNDDGVIEPGETVSISPELINLGDTTAETVTAELSCEDTDVNVLDANASYDSIGPNGKALPDLPFVCAIDASARSNRAVKLNLMLHYQDHDQLIRLNLPVGRHDIACDDYIVYDFYPGGDGDGVMEPGETVFLDLILKNRGWGYAHGLRVSAASSSAYLTLLQNTALFPELAPDSQTTGLDRLWIHIDESAPPAGVELTLMVHTNNQPDIPVETLVSIGQPGFRDDMESGDAGWNCNGSDNLWHRSSSRAFSGDWSWHCGQESSGSYLSGLDCSLTSPEFYVGADPVLHFYRWFEFPLYGGDGVNIEVEDGDEWITAAFIGGGGALNMQSDWSEDSVELPVSHTTTRVRFRFFSDDVKTAEGFYLDDVSITSGSGSGWHSQAALPEDPEIDCTDSGVTLEMPRVYFHTGDVCSLTAWICNGTGVTSSCNLVVVLDVYGAYYFAPDWTSAINWNPVTLPGGLSSVAVLPPFSWPEGTGEATGLVFWGALLNSQASSLIGNYDFWEFGWGSHE